jgi:hypothetical protein
VALGQGRESYAFPFACQALFVTTSQLALCRRLPSQWGRIIGSDLF